MPLQLIRSETNQSLWSACSSAFLDEIEGGGAPRGYPSYLWIAHRAQRDSVFELAAGRGIRGWFDPPLSFFSELRDLFEIRERPIGILTGRLLVARLARRTGQPLNLGSTSGERGPARSHMLDSVFSELLPEGVTPERLRAALDELEGDDFSRRRNEWVASTYESFLGELASRNRFDPREIHARVAERIEAGGLRTALRGARRLHIYGITSLRGRRRLFAALTGQSEVQVRVYLPEEPEPSEWDSLGQDVLPVSVRGATGQRTAEPEQDLFIAAGDAAAEPTTTSPRVQPAPDAVREAAWIASQVKHLLAGEDIEPHRVAIVARSGRRDTRLVHDALRAAGVPSTARVRTPLAEIPVLKALLGLFQGEALGWTYRTLRPVLASPYFRLGIDLRAIDWMAKRRRVEGLDAWITALEETRGRLDADSGWRLEREGIYADRLDRDIPKLQRLVERVADLRASLKEHEWIDLTLDILDGERFGIRRRLCQPVGDRWDIVRLDQRGVLALEGLLQEWQHLVESDERFDAAEWHRRLRRLLQANEIALSTPLQAGVQILEAHQAALTPFECCFVMHANDAVFPNAPGHSGVFSEAERRRLRELGLPLTHLEEAMRRERTLWRSVTRSRSVTITYRTTDANGLPRLPSLMVPAHDPASELSRTLDPSVLGGRERASGQEPVSRSQHMRREVTRLARIRRGGDVSVFESCDPAMLRQAVVGAFAEELRHGALDEFVQLERQLAADGSTEAPPLSGEAVFGIDRPMSERPHAWNGRIRDPAVLAVLDQRFGADYPWSASQLQQYSVRPFDFFLQRVMRLDEAEEAEEETTPLAFGSVAHDILERFYREVMEDLPPEFDDRAAAILDRITDEVFRDREADADEWLGLPTLWAVQRAEVREAVREFLRTDLRHLAKKGERPLHVEREFGFTDDDADPAVTIHGHDMRRQPASLLLRGRVDRIDRIGTGADALLKVIDYKSGGTPSAAGYEDGALLQNGLYMRAVEEIGLGSVGVSVFRSIKRRTMDGSRLNRQSVDGVLRFALSVPGRVRAGLFEAVQARSVALSDWQPGLDVTRTAARISAESRYHMVAGEEPLDDA
jgi:RecB family exonuclease